MQQRALFNHLLIGICAFNLLPQVYLRPYLFSIVCGLMLGYRLFLESRDWPMPPRWLRWLAQVFVTYLVYQHYETVFLEEASGTLLTLLLVLKLYELRQGRDYFVAALLCLLVLMSYLLLDQSLFLTLFLVIDVLLIVAFLLALQAEQSRLVQRWPVWVSSTFWLLVKSAPVLVIAFLLFPRFSTGFGVESSVRGKMGLPNALKPGSVAQLISNDELIFRATFLGQALPARESLYWRGLVLDVSRGIEWERSQALQPLQPVLGTQKRDIEVHLESGYEKFLFTLERTSHVEIGDVSGKPRVYRRDGGVFELDQPLKNRERYFLTLGSEPNTQEPPAENSFLQVQWQPDAEVLKVLLPWRGLDQTQIVKNILQHFKTQGFSYSLQPAPSKDLNEFLIHKKQGFCEHYAGTMATLLRWLGVPARVVLGFQGGTPSYLGNYVSLRGYDAHAWVEYFDSRAKVWQRVDPTAQVAPLRLVEGGESYVREQIGWWGQWLGDGGRWYFQARSLLDEMDAAWVGFLLRFDLNRQKELLAQMGMEGAIFRALPVFMGLFITLALAFIYFFEAQRRPHLPVEERLYQDLQAHLRRHWRIQKAATQGPLTLRQRFAELSPHQISAFDVILERILLARFGAQKLNAKEVNILRRQLRRLRPE